MKKKTLFFIMLLCTICSWGAEMTSQMVPAVPSGIDDETEATETYDLWIQGERVTSKNCNSFYWGNVNYDAKNKTLYFNGDCWLLSDYINDYTIVNGIEGLTMQFNGNCGLEGMKGAIYSTEHFVISGNGANNSSIMITDYYADSPSIYAEKGLTVKNCDLAIYGMGNTGIVGNGTLALNGCKLYCSLIKGFDDMNFYGGSYMTYPETPYDTEIKVIGGGNSYVSVDVSAIYELTVAGVKVSNVNANDILSDNKVSYDSKTNILTLKDVNIEYDDEIISSSIKGLTILLLGNNVLTSHNANCIDYSGENMTIEGYTPSKSTLKLQQNSNGTTVGGSASFSGNTLIKNCTVNGYQFVKADTEEPATIEMQRAHIAVANIEGFDDVVVSNGYINTPSDCSYDKEQKCFVARGEKATSLDIKPYLLAYKEQDVTPSNPIPTKSGVVTYDADAGILTMTDAELGERTEAEGFAIYDDMTIKLEGTNKLNARSAAIRLDAGDLTIKGPGRLDIYAETDALVEKDNQNAWRMDIDQSFTLKNTTLYCWTLARRTMMGSIIFNVINSNFTFDQNPIGYQLITYKKVNLTNCNLIEPEAADVEKIYPTFEGKIVIETSGKIYGDIDCDGKLDIADVTCLIKYLNDDLSSIDISAIDIDGNGALTKQDVEALVDMILDRDR